MGQARRPEEGGSRKDATQRGVYFFCVHHHSHRDGNPTYTTVKPCLFLLKSFIIAYCCGSAGAVKRDSMKKLFLLFCASAGALLAQAPTITSVVNSEIPTSGVLCPGLLSSIYGTGFGSGSTSTVVVLVGGQKAYVVAVTPTQVNVQLPFNAPLGATTVVV